jgi:hypothetical protein
MKTTAQNEAKAQQLMRAMFEALRKTGRTIVYQANAEAGQALLAKYFDVLEEDDRMTFSAIIAAMYLSKDQYTPTVVHMRDEQSPNKGGRNAQ